MYWDELEAHQKSFRVVVGLALLILFFWYNDWMPASWTLGGMLISCVWAFFIFWLIFGIMDWRDSQYMTSYADYRVHRERSYERQIQDVNDRYDRAKHSRELTIKSQERSNKDFAKRVKRSIIGTKDAKIIELVAEVLNDNPRIKSAVKKQLSQGKKQIKKRRRQRKVN